MYEFGCFAAFWSNFELLMEVAIWKLTGRNARENCTLVNHETAGIKRGLLEELLVLLAALGGADDDVVVTELLAESHFDAGTSALVDMDKHEAAVQRNDHGCNGK